MKRWVFRHGALPTNKITPRLIRLLHWLPAYHFLRPNWSHCAVIRDKWNLHEETNYGKSWLPRKFVKAAELSNYCIDFKLWGSTLLLWIITGYTDPKIFQLSFHQEKAPLEFFRRCITAGYFGNASRCLVSDIWFSQSLGLFQRYCKGRRSLYTISWNWFKSESHL